MSRTTTAIWVIFICVGGATICRSLSLAMFVLRASPGALAQITRIRSAQSRPHIAMPQVPAGPWSGPLRAPWPTALQLEQPDGGQLVGNENIEEPTVQCTQNR